MRVEELLARLGDSVRPAGGGRWVAACPAHEDHNPSLAISLGRDGRILLKCFGGCSTERVVAALGLEMSDLFPQGGGRGAVFPPRKGVARLTDKRKANKDKDSRPATSGEGGSCGQVAGLQVIFPSLRLEELAQAKKLPQEFLAELGIQTIYLGGRPVVRIPYRDERGEEVAVRFRLALAGETRFKWRKGDKPSLYGLQRLKEIRRAGWAMLVEGESDCWTLWHHGLPALGLPGASNWKTEWAAEYLKGLEVYLWAEPDDAGEALSVRLAQDIPGVRIIKAPEGVKDPSELHLQGRDVRAEIERLKAEAVSGEDLLNAAKNRAINELAEQARAILEHSDPLWRVEEEIKQRGYGGDVRFALITYLAASSRLLRIQAGGMPVHLTLQGRPSCGKSYTLQRVLDLLPEEAFHRIDAASPRALIFDSADLRHRVTVFSEADSIPKGQEAADNPAASAIRTLLQDGVMSYNVVEKGEDGQYRTREVRRPGPSVLLTTTTKGLGEQLGSRLFTLEIPDNQDRLREILAAVAQNEIEGVPDPDPALIAYQGYLQKLAPWEVVVPFARELARAIGRNPEPRVTRDLSRLLSLVKTVAVLRHRWRQRDDRGRLVAEIEDYQKIYELCRDMYEMSAAGCSPAVRELVGIVGKLHEEDPERAVSFSLLAEQLRISRQAVQKRAKAALAQGWLVNRETRPGRPADLAPGEPLPEVYSLPTLEEIEAISEGCNPATPVQPSPQPGGAEEEGRRDADSEGTRNPATQEPGKDRGPLPLSEKEIIAICRGLPESEWRRRERESEPDSTERLYFNNMARLRRAISQKDEAKIRELTWIVGNLSAWLGGNTP